jgi:hypothetical protein
MRSLILILCGLALLAVLHIALRNRGVEPTRLFLAIWFAVTILNLLLGLRAGYSLAEEIPIQALVFGVPAVAALLLPRFLK